METIDNYKEHKFHERPFWKGMKTCSECYKEHNRIKKEFQHKTYGGKQDIVVHDFISNFR